MAVGVPLLQMKKSWCKRSVAQISATVALVRASQRVAESANCATERHDFRLPQLGSSFMAIFFCYIRNDIEFDLHLLPTIVLGPDSVAARYNVFSLHRSL